MRSVSRWGGPRRGYQASSSGPMGTSADFTKSNKKKRAAPTAMVSAARYFSSCIRNNYTIKTEKNNAKHT